MATDDTAPERSEMDSPEIDAPPAVALAVCDNGQDRPEPVQLAVCHVDGGQRAEPVSWLVRPATPITALMTTRVHGIADTDVADAPTLDQVWPRVADAIAGRLLVVHHAGRVLRLLAGQPDPGPTAILDTLRLARRRRVIPGGSYALGPLLAAIGVDAGRRPHREQADWTAVATAALFAHLVTCRPRVPFAVLADWCRAVAGWPTPLTPGSWPTVLREPTPIVLPNPALGAPG